MMSSSWFHKIRAVICFFVGGWLIALDIHASVDWMSLHVLDRYAFAVSAMIAVVCSSFTSMLIGGGLEVLLHQAGQVAKLSDKTLRQLKFIQLSVMFISVIAVITLCYALDIISTYYSTANTLVTVFLVFTPEVAFSLTGYHVNVSKLVHSSTNQFSKDVRTNGTGRMEHAQSDALRAGKHNIPRPR